MNDQLIPSNLKAYSNDTFHIDKHRTLLLMLQNLYVIRFMNDQLIPFNLRNITIIIIYHDLLPTPRRGSDVKSGKTHTVIKIHPLAHILDS